MAETHGLKVLTTSVSRSTKMTYYNSAQQSQIDHVFKPLNSFYKLRNLRASWSTISTDHKRLTWRVVLPLRNDRPVFHKFPKPSFYHSTCWELSLLVNPNDATVREKYEAYILECLEGVDKNSLTWEQISSIACFCSEKLLRRKNRTTPELTLAYQTYKNALSSAMKQRLVDKNPDLVDPQYDYPPAVNNQHIQALRLAHKNLERVKYDKPRYALEKFLDIVDSTAVKVGQKVQMAFEFLKAEKRSSNRVCSANISLKDWTDYQVAMQPNAITIDLLPENDMFCDTSVPTYLELVEIVKSMKNGKTPGFDQICVEMLKASDTLLYVTFKILQRAYRTNVVPEEWIRTYSVPIPKIRNPKTTSDFRLLTMSSNVSKLYAVLLMRRVTNYLPPIDSSKNFNTF